MQKQLNKSTLATTQVYLGVKISFCCKKIYQKVCVTFVCLCLQIALIYMYVAHSPLTLKYTS